MWRRRRLREGREVGGSSQPLSGPLSSITNFEKIDDGSGAVLDPKAICRRTLVMDRCEWSLECGL